MASSASWVRQLTHYPLPGTSTLFVLDRISILNWILPLDRPIEAGISLDVEKRKQPGSDYSSYVSHGIDTTPIRIALRLFKDLSSGKNWFENYDQIKDRLVSKFLSARNAVPVFHPLLDMEGINNIVFTDRTILQPAHGQFFTVQLTGFNPKTLHVGSGSGSTRAVQDLELDSNERRRARVASGGQSAPVGITNQSTQRPPNRNARSNVTTPGANQAGQARRRTTPG